MKVKNTYKQIPTTYKHSQTEEKVMKILVCMAILMILGSILSNI